MPDRRNTIGTRDTAARRRASTGAKAPRSCPARKHDLAGGLQVAVRHAAWVYSLIRPFRTGFRWIGSVSRSVTVGRGASRPASSVTGRLSAARGELESSRHMPGSARLCERFDGPGQPPDAIRSRLRSADDLGSFLVFAVRAVGRAGAAGTVHHQASAERAGQDGNEQLKRPHRAPARKFDHVPGDGSKACHLRGQRPRPDPDALLSLVCPAADIPPRSLPRPPST